MVRFTVLTPGLHSQSKPMPTTPLSMLSSELGMRPKLKMRLQ